MSIYTQLQLHINNKLWKQLEHLVKKHIFHFITSLKTKVLIWMFVLSFIVKAVCCRITPIKIIIRLLADFSTFFGIYGLHIYYMVSPSLFPAAARDSFCAFNPVICVFGLEIC